MAWLNSKAIYSVKSIYAQARHKRKKSRKQKQADFADQVQSAIDAGIPYQVIPYQAPAKFEAKQKRRDRIKELEAEVAQLKRNKRQAPRYEPGMKSEFYETREWRSLRFDVIKESDGKCKLCGRSRDDGVIMHVDHIKPRSKFPALELVFSNLQLLCEDCNLGKSNK